MTIVLSLFLGIAASVLAWMALIWYFTPRIRISDFISVRYGQGTRQYRVKVLNLQTRRAAVRCSASFEMRVQGLRRDSPSGWTSFWIPVGTYGQGGSRILPADKGNWVIRMDFSAIERDEWSRVSAEVVKALKADERSLDDVMSELNGATIRLIFTVSDQFSGFTRTYIKNYAHNDFKPVRFLKRSVAPGEAFGSTEWSTRGID